MTPRRAPRTRARARASRSPIRRAPFRQRSLQIAQAWECGNDGNHNVRLNGTVIGTIPTSSAGCVCDPAAVVRQLVVSAPASYVANGTNTVLVDTIPGSGCYTIGPNPGFNNGFARVTIDL